MIRLRKKQRIYKFRKDVINVDRTLPSFQPLGRVSTKLAASSNAQQAGRSRYIHHCVEAASHKFEEGQCRALKSFGLERLFDGLRAAVNIPFHFDEYAGHIIGEEPSRLRQLAVHRFSQCPNLHSLEALQFAFQKWTDQPSLCTLMTVFLAATACKESLFGL